MRTGRRKVFSFSQMLVTYSVILILSLLLLGSILFAIIFGQLSAVQQQTSRYTTVMNLASHISSHREAFNRLIFTATTDVQKIQAVSDIASAEIRAKQQLQRLETSYEVNSEQYFLLRGIWNGLDFINQQQDLILQEFPLDITGFTRYYTIEMTYNYLDNYIYSRFLSSVVAQDAQAVQQMQSTISHIRILSLVLVVFFAVIYTFIIIFIVRSLARPIHAMMDTAREITKGNLETPDLAAVGPSEIRFLEQSLNSMKTSLKERIETLAENASLEKRIHQQELQQIKIKRELDRARLLTLQAQINPHFLFNAMNTISRTALFEQADQTADLVTDLAGIFRYMLDQRTTVTLAEEFDFIRKYLTIQKIRFAERLEYELQDTIDEAGILIPPLIIQPLVENAIIHGLEPLEEGGRVQVIAERIKRSLFIIVRDTGMGIDPSEVEKLLGESKKLDNSHIGMANVQERIKLYYGKKANMSIERAEPRGTVIRLTLPIRKQDRLGG